MLVQVVSGFPPHLSVQSELPGSWKYSPIFGLVGAVDTTGGAVDVEVGEGFACDPADAVGLVMLMNGVHSD